ncbi:MAG: sugar phosphate isomerase/epimerase [Burkholderiales bacterium]|nr:sugar phosphate isomerase/epimerase [Burkholderiales bacterium]GIK85873.1 MAG: xylose isomerase [Betaproteobacteria bacterium]
MLDPQRLSIHQVTLPPSLATPAFVELLARHRVPATSLWREKTRAHGVAATARLVADHGIALTGYCFAGLIASPDPSEAAAARDDVRRALDEAAQLRAPCVVFVAGGVDARDRDIAAARARVLDGLAELVPHARAVGVRLALEPLHPMICATRSVLSTVKLANDWCDRLGAEDAVGIAVDTYAVWWDPEIGREIARAGARICSFHVSDWLADTQDLRLDRGMPGDGVIDLAGLRRQVEEAGYRGHVEVEIFSQRNWWQRDPDEVVRTIAERAQVAL